MKRLSTSTMVVYFLFLLPYTNGQLTADAKRLLQDKLANYDRGLRPVTYLNKTLIIGLGIELVSIVNFDEVNQMFVISAILQLLWYDDHMIWNSTEYGGIETLSVKSKLFWTPNLVLLNNIYTLKKIGEPWLEIRFNADGQTLFSPGEVFSATCEVDVTYFPMDEHKCALIFVVWGAANDEISLRPSLSTVSTSYYAENSGWTLVKSRVRVISDEKSSKTSIMATLHLRRKSRFVVVNMIIPIVLMSALNILSFLLPTECGERIAYCITLLLTIAVFLTIVVDGLPNISNPMAIFGYYLLGILFLSSCIVVLTLVSINAFYKDEKELKNIFWNFFVLTFFRKRSRITPKECFELSELADGDKPDECKAEYEHGDSKSPTVLHKDQIADIVTWQEISRMFDKVCFVLASVILALLTIIFFSTLFAVA